MSLLQEYKQKNSKEPEVLVPDINIALPSQSPVEQQVHLGQQAPVPSSPMPSDVEVVMPSHPDMETLASPVTDTTLEEASLSRNLQVSDVPKNEYPVLFDAPSVQTLSFTPFPKYEEEEKVPLTGGISVPLAKTQEAPWYHRLGRSTLEFGGKAVQWAGNVTSGIAFDVLNLPNRLGYINDELSDRTKNLLGVKPADVLETLPGGLGALGRLSKVSETFRPLATQAAKYFDKKKEDEELTWEDFVPKIALDPKRTYSAEAFLGRSAVTSTEDVREVGKKGKSPIGTYQPRFDKKGKINPTWWAGLATDIGVGLATGLTLERGAVKGAGAAAKAISKGSPAAVKVAEKTASVVLDPVGELVLQPVLSTAAKTVGKVAAAVSAPKGAVSIPDVEAPKKSSVLLLDGTSREVSSFSSISEETSRVIKEFEVSAPRVVQGEATTELKELPSVNSRVFSGTMSLKEFSDAISEQVPGTRVDVEALSKQPRTLQQLHSLARRVYKDGAPLLSERVPHTFTELNSKLDSLQLLPSERRLFERYGYPIPEEALSSPDFRIVVQDELPAAGKKELSVLQTNRQAQVSEKLLEDVPLMEGATDVKVEGGVRSYKVKPTYVKPKDAGQVFSNLSNEIRQLRVKAQVMRDMGNVRGSEKIELDIAAKEAQFYVPDVRQPDQLRIVQEEVLPSELHGTSDEVIGLTDAKLHTEVELKDLGDEIDKLSDELEDVKVNLDSSANRVVESVDVGRKLSNEELPVVRRARKEQPPMVREDMEPGIVSRPNEGTWFHGTRVVGLQAEAIDPVAGGKRSEWGTGMYLTRDPELADGYARADISPNIPSSVNRKFSSTTGEVIEYEISHAHKALYAHKPFSISQAEILRDVVEENLGGADGQRVMKLMDKKATLSQALGAIERLAAKKGFTEAQLTKLNREISLGFLDDGVDVVYDGNTMMVLNPSVMKEVRRSSVDLSSQTPLEVAGHRFNVESTRALQNPESLTAQVDFEESSVRLQAEVADKLEKDVKTLEKQRSKKLRELLDTEDALEEAATKERLQRSQELTEKARALKEKELKTLDELNNPCEP